jgi:hypothetical protein
MGAQAASIDKDFPFYAKDQQVLYRWDVDWYYATGVQDGAQSARPTNPGAHDAGLLYLETDIGPPLPLFWWSGSQWLQVGGGTTGAQGAPGTQGPAGAQGATGAGVQGPPGPQGPGGGAQGPPGLQGFQGTQGTQGVQGAGLQGPQGTQGHQGFQGQSIQGSQGYQGRQGYQGNQGATGNNGPQGAQGTSGSIGPQGPAGSGSSGATTVGGSGGVQVTPNSNGYNYFVTFSEPVVAGISLESSGLVGQKSAITYTPGAGSTAELEGSATYDAYGNKLVNIYPAVNIDPNDLPRGNQGPAGPSGPVGPAGAQGSPGSSGAGITSIVGAPTSTVVSDTFTNVTATVQPGSSNYNSSTGVLTLAVAVSQPQYLTTTNLEGLLTSPTNTILIAESNSFIHLDVNQSMMASQAWVQSNYVTGGQLNSQIQDLQNQIDYLNQDLQELEANCCEY